MGKVVDSGEELESQMTDGVRHSNAPSRPLLADIFDALEAHQVPYCVAGGCENFPDQVDSDVDLLVPSDSARNLSQLAMQVAASANARILQAQDHRTGSTFTFCRVQGGLSEM